MANKKLLLSLGCISLLSVSLLGVVASKFDFKSYASGITSTNKDRTFTLNTPLDISGIVGTRDYGNLAVYAPNCTSINNGVARLNDGQLVIYCPTAELDGNGYYQGFGDSRISAVSITFNNLNTTLTLRIRWGRMNPSHTIEWAGDSTSYSGNTYNASTENLVYDVPSGGSFLSNPAPSGYNCVCLSTYNPSNNPIDLINMTITFTCK